MILPDSGFSIRFRPGGGNRPVDRTDLRKEAAMRALGRRRWWVSGVLVVAAVAGAVVFGAKGRRAAKAPGVAFDETTPLPVLADALRQSDARALAVVFQKSAVDPKAPAGPLSGAEAGQ